MIDTVIKEGLCLDFPEGNGVIINSKFREGNYYINVAFGDEENLEEVNFKVYQVVDNGDKVNFVLVTNEELVGELNSGWVAKGLIDAKKENE